MKHRLVMTALGAVLAATSAARSDATSVSPLNYPLGVCTLTPANLIGANWGYASQGTALQGNHFGLTAGPFSQAGVASGLTASQTGTTITGTWSTTSTIIDSRGVPSTSTQPGTFTVNAKTCTGDFYWNAFPGQIIFRAVFVDGAAGFRSISLVPGVIISFPTGLKL